MDYRDAEFNTYWALATIRADAAYQRGYFGQSVTIAVIDDGMDIKHPDLADNIRQPWDIESRSTVVSAKDNMHGTYVALVAAGIRGNSGSSFVARADDGMQVATKNMQGVAPKALIMPLQVRGSAQPENAIKHAISRKVHIVNASIGRQAYYRGRQEGREGVVLVSKVPHFHPLLLDAGLRARAEMEHIVQPFGEVAADMADADTILVWPTGNDGWNSEQTYLSVCRKSSFSEDGCPLGDEVVSKKQLMESFVHYPDIDDPSTGISFNDMWGAECGLESCIEYDAPDAWGLAPLFHRQLMGKLLIVAGSDRDGSMASFSNGCGVARNWCLVAPARHFSIFAATEVDDEGNPRRPVSGTSFSAPIAAGALAVLKSRLPGVPMEVVQAVLLVSADPKGTRQGDPDRPDPTYGWGLLNLERAVMMAGDIRIARPTLADPGAGISALAPGESRVRLSAPLAHLRQSLQQVQLAVGSVRGAYYNMQMSGLIDAAAAPPRPRRFDAAARDMLAASGDHRLSLQEMAIGPAWRGRIAIDRQESRLRSFGFDLSAGRLGDWRFEHRRCADCAGSWRRHLAALDPAGTGIGLPVSAGRGASFALTMHGQRIQPFVAVSGGGSGPGSWRQIGMRWHHRQGEANSITAEVSRIHERGGLWGSDFSALGGWRSRTFEKRLLLAGEVGGGWRAFVDYRHSAAEAAGQPLFGFSGLRADRWSIGAGRSGMFAAGDLLRLSVRRRIAIRSGRMLATHVVATGGSFVDAFYRGQRQHLETRRTVIDLRGSQPAAVYRLGYATSLRPGSRIALGLEYDRQQRNVAAALHWRWNF